VGKGSTYVMYNNSIKMRVFSSMTEFIKCSTPLLLVLSAISFFPFNQQLTSVLCNVTGLFGWNVVSFMLANFTTFAATATATTTAAAAAWRVPKTSLLVRRLYP